MAERGCLIVVTMTLLGQMHSVGRAEARAGPEIQRLDAFEGQLHGDARQVDGYRVSTIWPRQNEARPDPAGNNSVS